jgi:isocitrate dehydrogenase kinase/phosphatase
MVERPSDLVQFIRSILPRKRIAEIYISLGYNKHGKTELYRDLLSHLQETDAQFEIAPGQRGMVMIVFSLPDYDLVFKLIKDRFAYPKKTTRQDVIRKYEMVFRHDRAGRLIDAQSFEFLQFQRARFTDELLAELLEVAGKTVVQQGETVVVNHGYIERQVIPLDIYLQEADEAAANQAIIDYGQTIKDLAVTNIFAGDMLLKNFGVTRHERLVFYDYDELRPLTECNFRKFPQAMRYEDELAAEPWFHINENDVFPEEFLRFMGLPNSVKETFLKHHSDLLDVKFWQETQKRLEAGEIITIRPYLDIHRLPQPSDILDN